MLTNFKTSCFFHVAKIIGNFYLMCVNHHLSNLPKRGPGLNPDTQGLRETHVEGKDVIIIIIAIKIIIIILIIKT